MTVPQPRADGPIAVSQELPIDIPRSHDVDAGVAPPLAVRLLPQAQKHQVEQAVQTVCGMLLQKDL